jgi:hypothetical protein
LLAEVANFGEPVLRGLEVQINDKLARLRALDDKAARVARGC